MTTLTLACAQIECRPGDLAGNFSLHLEALAEARARGADLVVFPELSLPDYVSQPDLAAVGMARDDSMLLQLAQAAGATTTLVGFVERAEDQHFIATATLSDGRVAHVHRKVNLATYGNLVEGHHYAAGDTLEVVPAAGWPAATLICADAWNPALPWIAALKGAELACLPIASSLGAVEGEFENPAGWDATLRQIAVTYALPVAMANHCGRRGGLHFWGGSRILDPYGVELARAGSGPEIILARVDREEGRLARERLPTVRDANPAFVARELAGLLALPADQRRWL